MMVAHLRIPLGPMMNRPHSLIRLAEERNHGKYSYFYLTQLTVLSSLKHGEASLKNRISLIVTNNHGTKWSKRG